MGKNYSRKKKNLYRQVFHINLRKGIFMANFTTYKKLELPTTNEQYNIEVFNENNRIIDSELHKIDTNFNGINDFIEFENTPIDFLNLEGVR